MEDSLDKIYRSRGVPVFPSLRHEKKVGYDLETSFLGYTLFLQFKRSEYIRQRHPKSPTWRYFSAPHFRVRIDSDASQLEVLQTLEAEIRREGRRAEVLYCAPAFHREHELNSSYLSASVLENSFLFEPSIIPLATGQHFFAATGPSAPQFLFSEPVPIRDRPITWSNLEDRIATTVSEDGFVDSPPEGAFSLTDLAAILFRVAAQFKQTPPPSDDLSIEERIQRLAFVLGLSVATVTVQIDDGNFR